MQSEENKRIAARAVEVWNGDDAVLVDEVYDPGYVRHDPNTPDDTGGSGNLKKNIRALRAVFPDLHVTVDDLIAEGDRVAIRSTLQATQKEEFLGIPPSGKRIRIQSMDIVRIEGGKIVEHWRLADALGMLQQLGAFAPPQQTGE